MKRDLLYYHTTLQIYSALQQVFALCLAAWEPTLLLRFILTALIVPFQEKALKTACKVPSQHQTADKHC